MGQPFLMLAKSQQPVGEMLAEIVNWAVDGGVDYFIRILKTGSAADIIRWRTYNPVLLKVLSVPSQHVYQ